jgi:hypothetical protein
MGGATGSAGSDTRSLGLRTTDIAFHTRLGLTPLWVSTNMLGVTALRAARLLAALRECGCRWIGRAGARSARCN